MNVTPRSLPVITRSRAFLRAIRVTHFSVSKLGRPDLAVSLGRAMTKLGGRKGL